MKPPFSTRAVLVLASCLLLGTSASGLDEGAPLTKAEIVNGVWKAMFGELDSKDIKSVSVERFSEGEPVPDKLTIVRPNLFRNDHRGGTLVFDGRRAAWVRRERDEQGNVRPPEMIESTSWAHFEVDIAILFPAFFDYDSELRGVTEIDGVQVYELQVVLPLGGAVTYFVDAKSMLIVKRLVSWEGKAEHRLWENRIERYVDYDGVRFEGEYSFQGRDGRRRVQYKNVKINIKPEARLFTIPEGTRSPVDQSDDQSVEERSSPDRASSDVVPSTTGKR